MKYVYNKKGFSLIELMVVVAIIGILATIAVPQVNKFMAKSRQSEAKTNLASLYTSEKAFFSEYSIYDSRFGAIGFAPEGGLRYNTGFGGAGVVAGAGNGYNPGVAPNAAWISTNAYCGAAGAYTNNCTMLNGATNAAPPALPAAAVTAAGGTFIAAAISNVFNATNDTWTINEQKNTINTVPGIP